MTGADIEAATIERCAKVNELNDAAKAVVDNAQRSYRARGKDRYIEDESGELMMLVPHEDWYRLEHALRALTPDHIADAGEEVCDESDIAEMLRAAERNEGVHQYAREHLPAMLRDQVVTVLMCDSEPHVVADAIGIVVQSAAALAAAPIVRDEPDGQEVGR